MFPIASGGMARIYLGRTTGIGAFERYVVLKIILPERANDITSINMFLDEARLAASLNHHNVAQVFEVGQDAGIHYLAMEYVHGQDLRSVLAKAGETATRIPIELGLAVVAGAAAGLHHAHDRKGPEGKPLGIVHRDVSPSNIMIGYDGAVKVLDFGIAKAAARSAETVSGVIKGKFAYMSPEQCRGREVDRRSDVFSLGILLYEITTQHRCFRADSDFDTMHRIVAGDVVKPTALMPRYPVELEALVLKALAVDPQQRFQSASEMLEAIEAYAAAARISLSTMALGRFMRDMFGEVPEPWLMPHAPLASSMYSKESTISNTNSKVMKPSLASRLLSMAEASPAVEAPDDSDSDEDAWNAKSFPTVGIPSLPRGTQEVRFGDASLPRAASGQISSLAEPPEAEARSPRVLGAPSPTGSVTAVTPQLAAAVYSSSTPVVASAQVPVGVPRDRYLTPSSPVAAAPLTYVTPPPVMRLRSSNQRAWLIGAAVLLVLFSVGVLMRTDERNPGAGTAAPNSTRGSEARAVDLPEAGLPAVPPLTSAGPVTGQAPARVEVSPDTQPPPPPPPLPENVTLHVVSQPAGAEVLLGGKRLGVTPFIGEVARADRAGVLVIRKSKYGEVVRDVTLRDNAEVRVTLKRAVAPKRPKKCLGPAEWNPFAGLPHC